jgi:hypothetical protein
MARVVILAGAPESSKLDWNEKSLLPSTHVENVPQSSDGTASSDKPQIPKWRQLLATDGLQMRPVLPKLNIRPPQPSQADSENTEFFTPTDFVAQESPISEVSADESQSQPSGVSAESTPEALDDFYDHSFNVHEAVPSSQLSEISEAAPGTPVFESSEEMFSPSSERPGGIMRTPSQRRLSQAPRPKILTDLAGIPNAAYLSSIQPQTMTVNLIVGIISISPTRKVMTGRRFGKPREVELIEVTVGDNTKTGFNITMWLPREMRVNWKDGANATPEGSRSELRRALKLLRPRDVVMIQNVALSSYQGKVHGQSLRRDVTKIDLLFRRPVDESDLEGVYRPSNLRNPVDPQLKKVKAVRDWLLEFAGDGKKKKGRGLLPADTQ